MKKKLLVTGATGFLGSHVAERIKKINIQSFLFAGHEDREKKVHKMDLADVGAIRQIFTDTKPDIVIHLGGMVDLTRDFQVAKDCIDTNLLGTLHIVESMRTVKPKLLIYVSTEEIYGSAPIPYRETSLPHPPSPYAMTKLGGEHLSAMYGGYLGFPVVILRVGTMYGPAETEKRFIPSVIMKALRNETIPLNSGKKARDYVFVEDVARALIACLDLQKSEGSEVINIGGGTSYSLRLVARKIVALCHSRSDIHFDVFPDRILESDIWHMDITKAKKFLNWEPKISLDQGLRQTIAYYR